ncbi:cupin domain-containing protein [Acidisphaera sp. L21]|uniref:cupin domain-containing protein n=1 Tax=Acidisphaera sp. L21 TaxID=1641851 RepID=UPI00131ABE93|nr:cupin domain-containing protein [Acidisphaera sp. L21]
MIVSTRRTLIGGATLSAGGLLAPIVRAAALDGHAAGFDVAPAADGLKTIPRRSGDPVQFTTSLDTAALKATSGGWAREITSRALPIATGIALAHLFLNPGGAREMHWHNSAEWAYVLGGNCQVTAQDPAGETEVVNLGLGDLWYFPRGHAHAIQALGDKPFHALLAFDDGLYSEHGTFGISDWMSRVEPAALAQALGVSPSELGAIPTGETYIMQGPVVPLASPQARAEQLLSADRTHRYRLIDGPPWASSGKSSIFLAGRQQFPICTTMTGQVNRLEPGAMQQLHWHPSGNEFHYVAQGQVRMTLFAADKRMAVANLMVGDCGYIPANCGHFLQNTGTGACEVVSVQDSPNYEGATLTDWLSAAPRHLLANNLGTAIGDVPRFKQIGATVQKPT